MRREHPLLGRAEFLTPQVLRCSSLCCASALLHPKAAGVYPGPRPSRIHGWRRLQGLLHTCAPPFRVPHPLAVQDITWHEDRWDDPESRFLAFTLHDRCAAGHTKTVCKSLLKGAAGHSVLWPSMSVLQGRWAVHLLRRPPPPPPA